MIPRRTSAGAVAALVAALAVVAVAAAAGGGREKIRFNAADQAAARAVVIRRADLGAGAWRGGATKPDLSPAPTCANYHPKQSDLVLTGAAETHWLRGGIELDSEGQVLRTARMVRLDWQRSVQAPGVIPCLRKKLVQALGSNAKLVSFRRIAFPHIATYAAAYRMIAEVRSQGTKVRVMLEPVLFGRSRTEISLIAIAPAASTASVAAATQRLARTLVARVRA